MSKTYKTDPWDVKESRGAAWHPLDLSKRLRARERREMARIAQDLEAWEAYYPTGAALREFKTAADNE